MSPTRETRIDWNRSGRLTTLLTMSGLLLCSVPIHARADESDYAIWIQFPFLYALLPLCLLWLIAGRVLDGALRRDAADKTRYAPGCSVIVCFGICVILFSLPGLFGMGGFFLPVVVAGASWMIHLFLKVAWGLIHRPEAGRARSFLVFHCSFLVLAMAAVGLNFTSRSVDTLISYTRYNSSAVGRTVVPELIARGDQAVDLLISAAEDGLKNRQHDGTRTLTAALFCLGKIGGAKAEAFLGKVVREWVDFREVKDQEWQEIACWAYSECARERAVKDLIALCDRLEETEPVRHRWVAVAALARTRSRAGVLYALDHMDILINTARSSEWYQDPARASLTASTLLSAADPSKLGTIPLYRREMLFGPSALPESSPTLELSPDPERLASTWKDTEREVRARWSRLLNR